MPALGPRDAVVVAALVRRVGVDDPVALTNAAWFAARRGVSATALDCARRAVALPHAPRAAHRTLRQLLAGRDGGLLLSLPLSLDDVIEARPAAPAPIVASASPQATPLTDDEMLARGRALLETGHLAESLSMFDAVLRHRGADPVALFHRGVALAKLRRYGDALADWSAAERADPDGMLGTLSRRHASSAKQLADLFAAR